MHPKLCFFWLLSVSSVIVAGVKWDEGEWIPIAGPCKSCQKAKLVGQNVNNFEAQSNIEPIPQKRQTGKFSVRPGRLLKFRENVQLNGGISSPEKVQLVYLPEGSIEDLRSANLATIEQNSVIDLQPRPTRDATAQQQHFGRQRPQSVIRNNFASDSPSSFHNEPARPSAIIAQKGNERQAQQQIELLEAALSAQHASLNEGELPRVFIAPSHIPPPPGYIKIPLIPNKSSISIQDTNPGTFLTADVQNKPPPGFVQLTLPENIAHLSRKIPFVVPNQSENIFPPPTTTTESTFVTSGRNFNQEHLVEPFGRNRFSHVNTHNTQSLGERIQPENRFSPNFNIPTPQFSRIPNIPQRPISTGFSNNNFGQSLKVPIDHFDPVPFNHGKSFNGAVRSHNSIPQFRPPVSPSRENDFRDFPVPELIPSQPKEQIIVNQEHIFNNDRIRPQPQNVEFSGFTNPPVHQNTFFETTFQEIDITHPTQSIFEVENTPPPTPRPSTAAREEVDVRIGEPVVSISQFDPNEKTRINPETLLPKHPLRINNVRISQNSGIRETTKQFETTPPSTFNPHIFENNNVQKIDPTENEFKPAGTTTGFKFPTTISPNVPSPVKINPTRNDNRGIITSNRVTPQKKKTQNLLNIDSDKNSIQSISTNDAIRNDVTTATPRRTKPKPGSRRQRVRVKGRRRRPSGGARVPSSRVRTSSNGARTSSTAARTPSTAARTPLTAARTSSTAARISSTGARASTPIRPSIITKPSTVKKPPTTTPVAIVEISTKESKLPAKDNKSPSTLLPPFSVAKTLGSNNKATDIGNKRPSPLLRNQFGSRVRSRNQALQRKTAVATETGKKDTVSGKKKPITGKRRRVQRRRKLNGRRRTSQGAVIRRRLVPQEKRSGKKLANTSPKKLENEQLSVAESARVEIKHLPVNQIRNHKYIVTENDNQGNVKYVSVNKNEDREIITKSYVPEEPVTAPTTFEIQTPTAKPSENLGYVESNFTEDFLFDTINAPNHLLSLTNNSQQTISSTIYPFKANSHSHILGQVDINGSTLSESISSADNYMIPFSSTDTNRGIVESTTDDIFAQYLIDNETYLSSDSKIVYAFAIIPSAENQETTTMGSLSATEMPIIDESTLPAELDDIESTTMSDFEAVTTPETKPINSSKVVKSKNISNSEATIGNSKKILIPKIETSTSMPEIDIELTTLEQYVDSLLTTSEPETTSSPEITTNTVNSDDSHLKGNAKVPSFPLSFIDNFFSDLVTEKSSKKENEIDTQHIIGRSTITEVHSSPAVICFSNGKCVIGNGIRK